MAQPQTNSETNEKMRQIIDRIKSAMDTDDATILNVKQLLDDFLYILGNHAKDFEYIYNELDCTCDVNKCIAFQRMHRDRSKPIDDEEIKYSINQQIIDKIHCYFLHTLDIGYRLNSKEQTIVDNIKLDQKQFLLCNQQISKYYDILRQKNHNVSKLSSRISTRFYPFTANIHKQPADDDEKLQNDESKANDEKLYNFGTKFQYGNINKQYSSYAATDYISSSSDDSDLETKIETVSAKYKSFKQELTMNPMIVLSIDQYNNEYKKAAIHFDSQYRKQNYATIQFEYLLSLMVYCNFDALQNEFSKTYYCNIDQHQCFYHWAKNIKKCVHEFGETMYPTQIKAFYHGITQRLLFSAYVQYVGFDGHGVRILSALSTSSSFEVAINFAGGNEGGLVIEFGCSPAGVSTKYFSVSWLSDFPNEFEHLFIQNNYPIQMNNIIDVKSGDEYRIILNVLKIIEAATTSNDSTYSLDKMWVLIENIISNQLFYRDSENYNEFKSLSEYGKKLCKTYFDNKTEFEMGYSYKDQYRNFYDLLFLPGYEWIRIDLVCMLFPNIQRLSVWDVNLTEKILGMIVVYLQKQIKLDNVSKIQEIWLFPKKQSEMIPSVAATQYKQQFQNFKYDITNDEDHLLVKFRK